MPSPFRLTLEAPLPGQDNFFLWSMTILPIIAEGAYIFDAWYFKCHFSLIHNYSGLVSTIFIVFAYLRYCAPIESPKALSLFYIFLCILNEIGTIGYLAVYIEHRDTFHIAIYLGWAIQEFIMTILLLYCRVLNRCQPTFHVESKHLFHFISRLEVVLAIFIPFFMNNISVTLTKRSIAFFLLFDFFSDSYERFHGAWIKSVLYIFVCTVTVSVASEWIYNSREKHIFEILSSIFELISGCLCNILIIFQFIPYHLKPKNIMNIARDGLTFRRKLESDLKNLEAITDAPISTAMKQQSSTDTIVDIYF